MTSTTNNTKTIFDCAETIFRDTAHLRKAMRGSNIAAVLHYLNLIRGDIDLLFTRIKEQEFEDNIAHIVALPFDQAFYELRELTSDNSAVIFNEKVTQWIRDNIDAIKERMSHGAI